MPLGPGLCRLDEIGAVGTVLVGYLIFKRACHLLEICSFITTLNVPLWLKFVSNLI